MREVWVPSFGFLFQSLGPGVLGVLRFLVGGRRGQGRGFLVFGPLEGSGHPKP